MNIPTQYTGKEGNSMMAFMNGSTYAEIVSYGGKSKLGLSSFNVNLSYEDTISLFDELFEDCEFGEILTYFLLFGVNLNPIATDKIVLRLDNGNLSKLWIAIEGD